MKAPPALSTAAVSGGLAALCGALAVLSLGFGPVALPWPDLAAALAGGGPADARLIVWEIRAPRAMAALAAGAALGLSGAALQGLTRNPLAEPGTLGVTAAASLAAIAFIAFGGAAAMPLGLPLAATAGAGLATAVLSAVALRAGGGAMLLLAGIGLSSLCAALAALVVNLAPHPMALADLVAWSLGSVANRSWPDLALPSALLCAGALMCAAAGHGLRALGLGEAGAAAIGADPARIRALAAAGTGLLAGGATALAGAIGFVGLLAPHLVRPMVGHDPARALLPSALAGGGLLLAADLAVRMIPAPQELKLGVLAALIGAPAFAWIAWRQRGGTAWR